MVKKNRIALAVWLCHKTIADTSGAMLGQSNNLYTIHYLTEGRAVIGAGEEDGPVTTACHHNYPIHHHQKEKCNQNPR